MNSNITNPETDQRPLRICVVTSTYPRSEDDYAVPWLRESVARTIARGHEVTILAPSYMGLDDHTIDGVPVKRFRYFPARWERLTHEEGAPARIRNPWFQLLAAPYVAAGCRAAARLGREKSFDIVHAHWPFPHEPIGSAAAKASGAPLVMTAHGAEFAVARRKGWVEPILRRSLQKADLLIANSSHTAAQIRKTSGCDSLVIPFGTTVSARSAATSENAIPRILFTGRLIARKGVEYLLRAIPHILRHRTAEFVICGGGDLRESLEQEARELCIESAVSFLGFVSNEQLDREYAHCDIWVNPSIVDDLGDTEGLGVGAIEAYAHRKPVVTSRVGGIPDAVLHGITGLLVPQKDELALAAAILNLIDSPERAAAMGQAGFEFACERFDWERITDALEASYYGLCSGRVTPPLLPVRSDSTNQAHYDEDLTTEACVIPTDAKTEPELTLV